MKSCVYHPLTSTAGLELCQNDIVWSHTLDSVIHESAPRQIPQDVPSVFVWSPSGTSSSECLVLLNTMPHFKNEGANFAKSSLCTPHSTPSRHDPPGWRSYANVCIQFQNSIFLMRSPDTLRRFAVFSGRSWSY